MELNIHQYSIKIIKWLDFQGKKLITRKYYGEPLTETENEITIEYNKKIITLNKQNVFIDYEVITEMKEVRA